MKKLNSPWSLRLLSLLFAILLFAYVNQTKLFGAGTSGNNAEETQLTSNKTAHISVPLQLNVNNTKYFVTGYPEKVNVKITGPTALVTTTVNTQNFKVYADLTKLGVGYHKVRLYQDGLNNELRYYINPAYIYVNIQPRKTVEFPVTAQYTSSNIADGYYAGKPVLGTDKVKITGAQNEIAKIKNVVAQLSIPQDTKKTISSSAVLEALDRKGRIVNVIVTPSTTSVNLPISSGNNKNVPIKFKAENGSSKQSFSFSSDTDTVKVFGTKKQLKAIKHVTAYVDVSGITSKKVVTVALDKNLNEVSGFDPDNIKVTVKPE
ncbi:MAG: CdaR family protein [Apilactobacillus sp.]|uniref:CdaR family protein n=1 Tax=Apilactobacillus TaxID=2767877 RepID=UPI0025EC1BD8|nr:CdaR family protein [Apilactobacillus sp.]MCT6822517.1 CdaR family protein [Apilactobacillus sp.]MCT6858157.1 CdaR family protein [Apilactobacillus sp.]